MWCDVKEERLFTLTWTSAPIVFCKFKQQCLLAGNFKSKWQNNSSYSRIWHREAEQSWMQSGAFHPPTQADEIIPDFSCVSPAICAHTFVILELLLSVWFGGVHLHRDAESYTSQHEAWVWWSPEVGCEYNGISEEERWWNFLDDPRLANVNYISTSHRNDKCYTSSDSLMPETCLVLW